MTNDFMQFEPTIEFAQKLDADDKLANFRNEFIIPEHEGKQQVYFLGNSLGLQPKQTKAYTDKILDQWAAQGVESFFIGEENWLAYHESLTSTLCEIVGCLPPEVTVMNQLTVNLHLMFISFYKPVGKRRKIICEAKAFPSDQYMLETHVRHYDFEPADVIIEVQPGPGTSYIKQEDIIAAIEAHKDELALVLFSGVNYYSGQLFNIQSITEAAHKAGAKAGFDLAHAAGNIELKLHDWSVDFACWCNYKYLNSGPGAIAAAYIHERYHNDKTLQRFAGWWGYQSTTKFKMEAGFIPEPTAEGWQLSTPSLLLYACLKSSLDVFKNAGWKSVVEKNKRLNEYAWFLLNQSELSFKILTPSLANERGCQLSLLMPENGKQVFDELTNKGFMIDWREPDVIRFAPVALYNSFTEIWRFITELKQAYLL